MDTQREPGRLQQSGDDQTWLELDPEDLIGDGRITHDTEPESMLRDNRIRAGHAVRLLLFEHNGSDVISGEQAAISVVVDLMHLADMCGFGEEWLDDAREQHRREITGDF